MAINQIIANSPVILFLGAGASSALGKPTMKEFVSKLKQESGHYPEGKLLLLTAAARDDDLELILNDIETFLNIPLFPRSAMILYSYRQNMTLQVKKLKKSPCKERTQPNSGISSGTE
jgi:hypothetical protein